MFRSIAEWRFLLFLRWSTQKISIFRLELFFLKLNIFSKNWGCYFLATWVNTALQRPISWWTPWKNLWKMTNFEMTIRHGQLNTTNGKTASAMTFSAPCLMRFIQEASWECHRVPTTIFRTPKWQKRIWPSPKLMKKWSFFCQFGHRKSKFPKPKIRKSGIQNTEIGHSFEGKPNAKKRQIPEKHQNPWGITMPARFPENERKIFFGKLRFFLSKIRANILGKTNSTSKWSPKCHFLIILASVFIQKWSFLHHIWSKS